MLGTDIYGTFVNDPTVDATFSRQFDSTAVQDFLFASGDGTTYLVANRDAVVGGFYEYEPRKISLSSKSVVLSGPSEYYAKWLRRTGEMSLSDPWISLTDHALALQQGLIIYAGNSSESTITANFLQKHNGANVWVRYTPKGIHSTFIVIHIPIFKLNN